MEGYGILNTINGDKYEGEFKSNEKEGYGIIYSKKGNRYKCQFKNDHIEGKKIIYYFNKANILMRKE